MFYEYVNLDYIGCYVGGEVVQLRVEHGLLNIGVVQTGGERGTVGGVHIHGRQIRMSLDEAQAHAPGPGVGKVVVQQQQIECRGTRPPTDHHQRVRAVHRQLVTVLEQHRCRRPHRPDERRSWLDARDHASRTNLDQRGWPRSGPAVRRRRRGAQRRQLRRAWRSRHPAPL